jgi:hypothetical protein
MGFNQPPPPESSPRGEIMSAVSDMRRWFGQWSVSGMLTGMVGAWLVVGVRT